ncbi:hypothetical protein [Candidatus Culexarchaeum yellowstonense]|uniref:hypothetical protein n=1 Tax=Candidatus Culexarchaeum yellowstonense TaxID=2928963 RepID=UPI0026F03516|nr:hypothetical protein [Candidatus Culexarchaeum yellowstonense]
MDEIEELKATLRERGLTDRQVEAGVKYYRHFASKFDIPIPIAANMIVNMIRNMREKFEKA